MRRIHRFIRISTWLIQRFLKRYNKYLIKAAVIGAVLVIVLWNFFSLIKTNFFPSRSYIGIIGAYPPENLPLSIQKYISQGFTKIDKNGEALPLTVNKWEVDKEGKRYFFHLKKGILWHDGEEFTAYDVNYNFKDVIIAPADRYTLKIDLEEPFAPLPTLLSRPLFKSGLIGIGTYKVLRLTQKAGIVTGLILKKVKTINTAEPLTYQTDIIEFRFYPSIESAILAFKLGEIDVIDGIPVKTELAKENNVSVIEFMDTSKILALFYNQTNKYLGSKEFRQALSYALDLEEFDILNSPFPKTSWGYNDSVKKYTYNIDKANELLKKSKIENASITISVFPEYLDLAEKIADQWRKLNITVNVQVIRSFSDTYDVLLGVQEIPSDPDQYQLWHSTQKITNITHYNNPKIDKLLEEGRKTQVKEERLKIYKEFQRYLMEDNPAYFITHPTLYTIKRITSSS